MGVGVVPAARRQGLGSALTVRAASRSPVPTSSALHPSGEARSMYERLGFERIADWEVWARDPGAVDRERRPSGSPVEGHAAPSTISRPPSGSSRCTITRLKTPISMQATSPADGRALEQRDGHRVWPVPHVHAVEDGARFHPR